MALAVMGSLNSAIQEFPREGWSRGSQKLSQETIDKIGKLQESRDFYLKLHADKASKLTQYESIAKREVVVYFEGFEEDGQATSQLKFSSEQIIKHFAATLANGFYRDKIEVQLIEMINHTSTYRADKIKPSSVDNLMLFFEVFDLIEYDMQDPFDSSRNFYKIKDEKKYLLKAAFQKESEVYLSDFDDEIPF